MYFSYTVNYLKNCNRPLRVLDGQRLETNEIGLTLCESMKCFRNYCVNNFLQPLMNLMVPYE